LAYNAVILLIFRYKCSKFYPFYKIFALLFSSFHKEKMPRSGKKKRGHFAASPQGKKKKIIEKVEIEKQLNRKR